MNSQKRKNKIQQWKLSIIITCYSVAAIHLTQRTKTGRLDLLTQFTIISLHK